MLWIIGKAYAKEERLEATNCVVEWQTVYLVHFFALCSMQDFMQDTAEALGNAFREAKSRKRMNLYAMESREGGEQECHGIGADIDTTEFRKEGNIHVVESRKWANVHAMESRI